MHTARSRFAVTGALLALIGAGCESATDGQSGPDQRLAQSRQAVAGFAGELKQRLTQAMQADGPASAVSVCAREAPAIALRVSDESGAAVSRTALRYRNPDNAPVPWQAELMQDFAARLAAGEDGAVMEHFATTPEGGARYIKPIVTAPLCLACHGELEPGPLADAIARYYPADEATGFEAGELRGAFVVEWPPR
ncbi:MAG: DUF3365 domain-containing protein [Pseudomonadota bacterium]